MQKVILNGCYGGYCWSHDAILEYLKRAGKKNIKYVSDPWDPRNEIPETKDAYLGPNGIFVNLYVDGEFFSEREIDRTDAIAIALLEEKGSEFCSGSSAKLYIDEYDDSLFRYWINDYDGAEQLELVPHLTKKQIYDLGGNHSIIELLQKCGVIDPDKEE